MNIFFLPSTVVINEKKEEVHALMTLSRSLLLLQNRQNTIPDKIDEIFRR